MSLAYSLTECGKNEKITLTKKNISRQIGWLTKMLEESPHMGKLAQ